MYTNVWKPRQIGAEQSIQHFPSPRQDRKTRRRERGVRKESNPRAGQALAQQPREQHELVIVDPDGVVVSIFPGHRFGKGLVCGSDTHPIQIDRWASGRSDSGTTAKARDSKSRDSSGQLDRWTDAPAPAGGPACSGRIFSRWVVVAPERSPGQPSHRLSERSCHCRTPVASPPVLGTIRTPPAVA